MKYKKVSGFRLTNVGYEYAEHPNGSVWYLDGKRHREDGPAIEHSNGTKFWYLNGKLHREDGPAVERSDGTKEWFLNGKLHREDGPAAEWADGFKAWWLNGREIYSWMKSDDPKVKKLQQFIKIQEILEF